MKKHQIESWALDIAERVQKSQPIEDYRVELKANWIDAEKAARRIAGHANAAHGNPILWLIGIDEDKGVIGADFEEYSEWWQQVKSNFETLAPSFVDLNIPIDDKTIVALYFDTDRAPYVVKNPTFGKPDGGPIQFEVPWREGTSVRSATRSDLIKILSPLEKNPDFELLSCNLKGLTVDSNPNILYWDLEITFYITPINENRLVIPFHKCEANALFSNSIGRISFENFHLSPPITLVASKSFTNSKTITNTDDEVIISGPGKIISHAIVITKFVDSVLDVSNVSISITSTNSE